MSSNLLYPQGLSALVQLTALTALTFSKTVLFNEALSSIAACPALQQLTLDLQAHERQPITFSGIMQLTHMRRLTELSLTVTGPVDTFFKQNLVCLQMIPSSSKVCSEALRLPTTCAYMIYQII